MIVYYQNNMRTLNHLDFEHLNQVMKNFNRHAYQLNVLKEEDNNVQSAVKLWPSLHLDELADYHDEPEAQNHLDDNDLPF